MISDSNRKLHDSKTEMLALKEQRNAAQEEKEGVENKVTV